MTLTGRPEDDDVVDERAGSLGGRLQPAFDWAAAASAQPHEGGPPAAQLSYAAAALRQAAGTPDDELGSEVLDCLGLARTLAPREAERPSAP